MPDSKQIKDHGAGGYIHWSPDLIAVRSGIKPVVRMECGNLEDFKKNEESLKKNSLKVVYSDEKLFGKLNAYISKSEKAALQAKKTDPSFKIINHHKEFNDVLNDVLRFGRLLGYPRCCVEAYIGNIVDHVPISRAKVFLSLPPKINFLMNNILNGVSNRYLSFHLPCSFACRETLDYQRAIFGAIRKTFPDFSKDIERCLRRPYVVFLNPALDSCVVSWDQRKGFGFGGCVKGGVLTYSEAAYFQTDYPEYLGRGSVSEFESLRNAIERGRRIVFKRGGKFQIYRSSKLLREFKNNGGNRAFLFNFV